MSRSTIALAAVLAAIVALTSALPNAAADEALDKAFDALKGYEWGADRTALAALDKAVADSHDDDQARLELEKRLSAVIRGDAPQAAKDIACRQLSLIGSAECVPAVSALLTDEKLSHMARYALERIPDAAAVAAMRDAMPKVSGRLKVGVINSLGVRRDAESADALIALLGDSDPQIAAAAAAALGSIGNAQAAEALEGFQEKAPANLKLAAADAYLVCAERLLADGKKTDALKIYRALAKSELKHVRVAGTRGMLAVAGKK
jgi:HEAT repeat protein